MAKIKMLDMAGKEISDITLDDKVFGIVPHKQAMFDAIIAQQSSLRQGTHSTKTKGEVSGGGRKPWRQKGTGRARAGSTRSPIWVGGGVAFGPKPNRNYKKLVNKKVRKLALRSLLSAKVASGDLIVLKDLNFDKPSTKSFATMLSALKSERNTFVTVAEMNDNITKSARNIERVTLTDAKGINVLAISRAHKMIVTEAAVKKIEEALA